MKNTLRIVAAAAATFSVLGAAGCGEDDFKSTDGNGGSGAATVTTTQGGAGGQGGGGGATTASTTTTDGTGGTGGQGGTGGAGGQGGTGGSEPVCQPLSDQCAQCAYVACEALYCECYAVDDCAQLVNCIQPCAATDTDCQQPCLTAHKDSISQAFLLGNCAAEPCMANCMGISQVGPCPECLFTNCPTQMNTCLANPECFKLIQCVQDGGDAFSCANMYPGGFNDGLAVQQCMGNSCPDICP